MHKVFLVAGEASADAHGAALVAQMRKLDSTLQVYGVGGDRLAAAGMEICVHANSLSVVGIADWLDKVKEVFRIYRRVVGLIETRKPDCAVLMDLPDFNLRLAKKLKRLGVPVVYYISPQVWAWRKYRIRTIRKYIDKMLVVLPFEKIFYDSKKVQSEFVGHPLLESVKARPEYRTQAAILESPRIALLPGSRRSEIRFHAPILRDVISKIREKFPRAHFQIPVASTLPISFMKEAFQGCDVSLEEAGMDFVSSHCDVAAVASGTATLETALVGTPLCIFYKMTRSSEWILKHLVRYKGYWGIPNLLLKGEVVREYFREKATADNIAGELLKLIEDEQYRVHQINQLAICRQLLGTPGASQRASAQIWSVLENGTPAPQVNLADLPAYS